MTCPKFPRQKVAKLNPGFKPGSDPHSSFYIMLPPIRQGRKKQVKMESAVWGRMISLTVEDKRER